MKSGILKMCDCHIKNCSSKVILKFRKIQRRTPALEPLFDKGAELNAFSFIKKETLTQVFSCEYCEIFKNAYFEEHL